MNSGALPPDLERLIELVVTRHVWGRGLTAKQMQVKLASALDDHRRHLVIVRDGKNGRLEIEFGPELGDVARAFSEAGQGRSEQSAELINGKPT